MTSPHPASNDPTPSGADGHHQEQHGASRAANTPGGGPKSNAVTRINESSIKIRFNSFLLGLFALRCHPECGYARLAPFRRTPAACPVPAGRLSSSAHSGHSIHHHHRRQQQQRLSDWSEEDCPAAKGVRTGAQGGGLEQSWTALRLQQHDRLALPPRQTHEIARRGWERGGCRSRRRYSQRTIAQRRADGTRFKKIILRA